MLFFLYPYQSIKIDKEAICVLSVVFSTADLLWHYPAGCRDNAHSGTCHSPLSSPLLEMVLQVQDQSCSRGAWAMKGLELSRNGGVWEGRTGGFSLLH